MKAMTIGANGAFEWKEVGEPQLGGDFNVLLEVKACALNRADVMQRAGTYAPPPEWPEWPGLECAGIVLEAPAGGRFKPGDAVCALLGGGGYAERVAVPEGMCMPLPKGFSFEQAAGAHRMMVAGENRGKIVMTI